MPALMCRTPTASGHHRSVLPYYEADIARRFSRERVIVSAHGNSLRALEKATVRNRR